MRFVNDDPSAGMSEAELEAVERVLRDFRLTDEVRVEEGARFLAPALNALTANQVKFYLVHLPGGGGWVLRRHRPTGSFGGTVDPNGESGS